MVNKKKEQFPIEDEEQKQQEMPEEEIKSEEQINEVPEHSHPELDQIIIKLQEIEQRLANFEMGGEEPGMEKMKEEIQHAPEREPDHEVKKQPEFENPEQLPQSKQPANGESPGDEDYRKYDNKAKDVEKKAIATAPNASGNIPKNESIKVKLDIEDEKGEEKSEEEPVMTAPQQMMGAPEEEPGLKKFDEQEDEDDEDEKKLKESDSLGTDPVQKKPSNDAPENPEAMKMSKELTKRQTIVNGESNNKIAHEMQMKKSVEEYLKKTNHFTMFKQYGM